MSDRSRSEDSLLRTAQAILSSDQSILQAAIDQRCSELGIPRSRVAEVLGMTRPSFDRYFNGETKKIDVEFVAKLAHFLGDDPKELASRLLSLLAPDSRQHINLTIQKVYLLENFDLKALKQVGFLQQIQSFDAIIERITQYLGLNSILEYAALAPAAFHSATKHTHEHKMRQFWAVSSKLRFQQHHSPYEFSRAKLVEMMPRIPRYSIYVEQGFTTVLRGLYEIGVTVHVQRYVKNTQVRGATMIVGEKPCIVVTDFGGKYDTLWFTLLHELAHVLYHWDHLQKEEAHLSIDNLDLYLTEQQANAVAVELLLSEKKRGFVIPELEDPYYVNQFAKRNGIHPSIVYGICAYECAEKGNQDIWRLINSLRYNGEPVRINSDKAIHKLISNPWNAETVLDDLEDILSVLPERQ